MLPSWSAIRHDPSRGDHVRVARPIRTTLIALIMSGFRPPSGGTGLEYDFAGRVDFSAELKGFASTGERQHFGYHRFQLPLIHECGDLIELLSIPADNEKYPAHAVLFGDPGRNRRNQCDQRATIPQYAPGTLPRFAADRVQHNIDAPQHFFERCGVVVNHIVSAQAAHERGVARRRRGQYAGASPACHLHCQRPYPASAAMDQHALAANEMRMFEERLPSG